MKHVLTILIVTVLLTASGCDQLGVPGPQSAQGAGPPNRQYTQNTYSSRPTYSAQGTYKPLYPPRSNWRDFAPGTITYDFYYAATAPTPQAAIDRWAAYLRAHPEAQDGFSKHYETAANIELMRAYAMTGRIDHADAILRKYDFSTLEKKP